MGIFIPAVRYGKNQAGQPRPFPCLGRNGPAPLPLHGLRRFFGNLSERIEVSVGVVAQTMGKKPSTIAEKQCRTRPLDLLRKRQSKIEAWILAEVGISQLTEGWGCLWVLK